MTADQIIDAARAALGTPFRHQGRRVGVALDCAGLIVHVAQTIGADYQDQTGYGRSPSNGLLESALDDQPCLDRVSTMQPADVLLMRFKGDPQHLALFTGDTIIHSYSQVGKVCEHRFADVWQARTVCVYRFRGIA
jgi:cell wall-associated NlpC family hydrolase